ncbi:MAG: recombinase family protein [Eubacterium sp.]|nr:recombinase family protein [Eubacterium sp.]
MKQQYNTALYLRLSRDDEQQGESGSISTQRDMLTQYCKEQNLRIVDEYVDDGWSGTNFDRPSFQRMIDDIEEGKINCVVTKDLSRLGRNYILTGQYTEIYFPSKGVRYIAVSDGVDTEKGESEIAPFLNILNEMHARQTSKKVKAALRTRFLGGAHYGPCPPIGYKRHPEIKGKLVPDEETRWIVEKIFDMAAHGAGYSKIRHTLDEEHIPTPAWLDFQKYGMFAKVFDGKPENKRHQWTTTNIRVILHKEVYIGNSVHNKIGNISFKNKKKIYNPSDKWLAIENTHEAIISKEIWEQAHAHLDSRKRPTRTGEIQIFAGLLKCPDCGWNMRFFHEFAKENRPERKHFMCETYAKFGKGRCSTHYIKYDVLYAAVLGRLQYWIAQAHEKDDGELLQRLLKSGDRQREKENASAKKELARTEKRIGELDNLFTKMYEDRVKEAITERNFSMLSAKYQEEQTQLENKKCELQAKLDKSMQESDGAEKWLSLIRKYTELTELTAPLLNELIDKIVIHKAVDEEDGSRTQEIEIFYRFVGKID